jgi:hypothetical protein
MSYCYEHKSNNIEIKFHYKQFSSVNNKITYNNDQYFIEERDHSLRFGDVGCQITFDIQDGALKLNSPNITEKLPDNFVLTNESIRNIWNSVHVLLNNFAIPGPAIAKTYGENLIFSLPESQTIEKKGSFIGKVFGLDIDFNYDKIYKKITGEICLYSDEYKIYFTYAKPEQIWIQHATDLVSTQDVIVVRNDCISFVPWAGDEMDIASRIEHEEKITDNFILNNNKVKELVVRMNKIKEEPKNKEKKEKWIRDNKLDSQIQPQQPIPLVQDVNPAQGRKNTSTSQPLELLHKILISVIIILLIFIVIVFYVRGIA